LLFGVLLREEAASRRQVVGIALGIAGLGLLFARRTGGRFDTGAIAGLAVAIAGALAYCLGSVLARPLLRTSTPSAVAASQLLLGGLATIPVVGLLEAPSASEMASLLAPAPLFGMVWMVFAGGVGATFIYMRLVRDWGPSRAGMYAFVTPIIATALGAIVLGERLGPMEVVGAVFMLSGAALVITAPRRIVDASSRAEDPAATQR
jgi:drug/metabolite transporter (DMT)-like permease